MTASRRSQKDGLFEYLLVLALFALAAVGTVAIFGDNVRALLGIGPSPAAARAPAPPPPP